MARTLSLTVRSGHLTLGNLLGAIRHWAQDQRGSDSLYGVADLHALTTEHDPASVRALTLEQVALLVAAGLDPHRCTIFVQSQVPAHTELHWLLEATAYDGENCGGWSSTRRRQPSSSPCDRRCWPIPC